MKQYFMVHGGRDYARKDRVFKVLDTILHLYLPLNCEPHVVHGAARGVDTFAEDWARHKQFAYTGIPAQWDTYGRQAGTRRNKELLDLFRDIHLSRDARILPIVFAGGRGTSNMYELYFNMGFKPLLPDGEFWK